MNNGVIHMFHPSIRPFVEEVVRNGRVGICSGNLKIVDVRSGLSSIETTPNGDRFKVAIPFAGQSLVWDMVFIGNSAEYPPDFAFDDKSFVPELTKLDSLATWNKDNRRSLLRLIQELLECYRQHQITQVVEHSRLSFEYNSLVQQVDFSENDVEVLMNKKNRNGPVNFAINLPIDFSKIPVELINGPSGEDYAVLLVTFNSPDGTKVHSQLYLSSRIEQAVGGTSNMRIPAFPTGGCLMDYVPNLCKLLRNKVEQVATGFEKRKDYIAAFLNQFGTSILEFDAETYKKLSFLFECSEFYFIVHINLPLCFPQEKPVLIFQSIYCTNQGRPLTIVSQDYPYSPRWDADEMADRARKYILEFLPTFQVNAVRCARS